MKCIISWMAHNRSFEAIGEGRIVPPESVHRSLGPPHQAVDGPPELPNGALRLRRNARPGLCRAELSHPTRDYWGTWHWVAPGFFAEFSVDSQLGLELSLLWLLASLETKCGIFNQNITLGSSQSILWECRFWVRWSQKVQTAGQKSEWTKRKATYRHSKPISLLPM